MTTRVRITTSLAALLVATTFWIPGSRLAAAPPPQAPPATRVPLSTTDGGVTNISANADTVPYWRTSFIDPTNGIEYPVTMVGTDPRLGDVTTTIPVVIIPLRLSFETSQTANPVLDGTDRINDIIQSPVFQATNIGGAARASLTTPTADTPVPHVIDELDDVTQVGDAVWRAEWNKVGTTYHVRLGTPTVLPAVAYTVPAKQGWLWAGSDSFPHRSGFIDIDWLKLRVKETLNKLHISSRVLPIVVTDNTLAYVGGSMQGCCAGGYHGASLSMNGNGRQQINTWIFAAYNPLGIFFPLKGETTSIVGDVHSLTHEIYEWMHDPFISNEVAPWTTPESAPFYGCMSVLESGDPLFGYGFSVTMPNGTTYHPEDMAYFSWFAHETPSRAVNGYYSYLNNFAHAAPRCQ